ncbi:OmpA family protein [Dankookia sp. GCM10030260]|uniref:OmpA family protein n=1 Tax=Dankookia sp. GCM10030260 TaxID=3273390 RepID=UPI00360BC874
MPCLAIRRVLALSLALPLIAPVPARAEAILPVAERQTPRGMILTVSSDLLFEFDRADLKPTAAEALGRVAEILRQRRPSAALVVGHTDSVGADSQNDALSQRRAEAVQAWLASQGGAALPRLEAEGRGEREPLAPNSLNGRDNPDGRLQNRRVEVLLEK